VNSSFVSSGMLLFAVARVPIVPVVHEHMQQRTQEEQRVRQDAEDVGSVFGQEEENGDG
jgi:sensor domain CHASE-containing protein